MLSQRDGRKIVAEWLAELWVKQPTWLARMPDKDDLEVLISKIDAPVSEAK
jgi:hypothetical protein